MEAANASRGTPHTYRGRRGAWGGQVVLVRGQTQLKSVVISPEIEAPFCSQVQDFGLFWRVEFGDCLMVREAQPISAPRDFNLRANPDGIHQGFDSTSC